MKFRVIAKEVWTQAYLVDAPDAQHAASMVLQGFGVVQEDEMEFSHMLDPDKSEWEVLPCQPGQEDQKES